MCEARKERGRAIADKFTISQVGELWMVPAQSKAGQYIVRFESGKPSCSCPDFELRQEPCKHCWAVTFTMTKVETNADGSTTVSTLEVKAKRQTYRQPWAAYNKAQTGERRYFHELLADLCDTIPEPPSKDRSKGGRPSIPLRDALFAAVMKVFSLTSARRFAGELQEAHERGYIRHCPHFNTVLGVFDKEETTPILRGMIEQSSLPLRAIEVDFAIDSTGFATTKYTSWHENKWGVEKKKAQFVKAHICTGVKTNIVTAVDIFDQHTNDCPQLPALVNATAENFVVREVSGDAAYPSQANFQAVRDVGGKFFPAFPRDTTGAIGGLFGKTFGYFLLKKEEYLAHYHKRSNVESTVSMIKRKFGDSVKAKNETAMKNEVYAKFVCHNLSVLIMEMHVLGIEAIFPAAPDSRPEPSEPMNILKFPTRL